MTTSYDPDALLMGGGGRSAKFENVNDVVVGEVLRKETRQRTEMGSGKLMTWPDGNPRMQLVITLQTAEHEDEDDDGVRNLYVAIPSQMQKAIADAVRKAGSPQLLAGGKLGVRFVRTEEPKVKGYNAQKIYTAKYELPVYDEAEPIDVSGELPF